GPDATGLRTALLRSGGLRWRVVAGARIQVESQGVDAVALAGGTGTVVEDVAQVAATAPAGHLGAHHPVTGVAVELHVGRHRRLGEAGPARARFELARGVEEHGPAPGAAIGAVLLGVEVLP